MWARAEGTSRDGTPAHWGSFSPGLASALCMRQWQWLHCQHKHVWWLTSGVKTVTDRNFQPSECQGLSVLDLFRPRMSLSEKCLVTAQRRDSLTILRLGKLKLLGWALFEGRTQSEMQKKAEQTNDVSLESHPRCSLQFQKARPLQDNAMHRAFPGSPPPPQKKRSPKSLRVCRLLLCFPACRRAQNMQTASFDP